MDPNGLTSAVIAHALRQHEDSVWSIVVDGMRRDEIKMVVTKAGATTRKQALRAVLDHIRTPVLV
jgi:hypothetical protein